MSKPLISVVVPVYNVENYLIKCVDSIVKQTYRNIEIILVDDGSTDACPGICDRYAAKDKRIRVIHKKNGGLSDARNTGINEAKGEYILFVDSDDYIDVSTISYLYEMVGDGSDIASILRTSFKEGSMIDRRAPARDREFDVLKVSGSIALNMALYEKSMTLHAWGKLYRRALFDDIRFPKGRIYEDIGTMYKVFHKANEVAVSPRTMYNYLLRDGSIVRSGFYPAMMDSVYFAKDMVDFASKKMPGSQVATKSYAFSTSIRNMSLIRTSAKPSRYQEYTSECWDVAKKYRHAALFNRSTPYIVKVYSLAAFFGRNVLLGVLDLKSRIKNK